MKKGILVEVCTGSLEDSIVAFKAGADRIELNSALQLGGLSPSPGVLSQVVENVDIPVIAMVRPNPGGFVYSERDKVAILRDAEIFLSLGAAGIATGALTAEGEVDTALISQLRELAGKRDVVFHRAFDLLSDLVRTASQLADLGVDRILTSGGGRTAWEGRDKLRELISRFGNRIEILPGSGITPSNVVLLVSCTDCSQVHGSFSKKVAYPRSATSVLPAEGVKTSFSLIRETKECLEIDVQSNQ